MLPVEIAERQGRCRPPAPAVDRAEARRQAGDALLAWLADAERVISQADARQVLGLAAELTGRRLRGAARR